jgi:hypothetical protein
MNIPFGGTSTTCAPAFAMSSYPASAGGSFDLLREPAVVRARWVDEKSNQLEAGNGLVREVNQFLI